MGFSAPLLVGLASILAIAIAVLIIGFVLVPLFKGVGWMIGGVFRGIGWFFRHVFEFIFGMIGDMIRFVGSIPVFVIFGVLSMLNVVIGRWSAATHFANSATRECRIGAGCLYRAFIRRPLKLLLLHGLLEGVEQRVPEAMEGAPGKDRPSRRTGQFDGYTIVGSLRSGGSGGKLYIAEPTTEKQAAIPTIPARVVIKSFALSDGSSLPQIVRESRALECAKQLGHVIEHGMNDSRFHYVMPYIPGDHLGLIARDLHARGDAAGLGAAQVADVMSYVSDLLATLSAYHKGGFWHKDVKPENVIVHDGSAHLVDLGLVTALRSAMTLTTHGTEYFRDPEMVRQALRGVKVHQVDGAKFDVFAVGAVLYFMLENTFPAHGALSAFQKRSPEALRWIIRRAMAEYHHRYQTAEAMLADLHHVRTAGDAFAVKPVDLPSMRGSEIPAEPVARPNPSRIVYAPHVPPSPQAHADAAPNREEAFNGYGIAAGVGAVGGAFAQVGRLKLDANGRPIPSSPGKRPRLRVLNWWTGHYAVDDPGSATAGVAVASRFGTPTPPPLPQAPTPAFERRFTGRTAKEQIKAARQRVLDRQARAKASRFHARTASERSPGLMMIFLGLCVMGGIALIVAATTGLLMRGPHPSIRFNNGNASSHSGPYVLVVNAHDMPLAREVEERVREVLSSYMASGYDVALAGPELTNRFAPVLERWWNDSRSMADSELEMLFSEAGAYGVVHVTGHGPRQVNVEFVHSTVRDADERRRPIHATSPGSVFVINDVPRVDTVELPEAVHQRIREHLGDATTIVQDTFLAHELRALLERTAIGDEIAAATIDMLLAERGMSGLLWFEPDKAGEDGEAGFRTHVHAVDASALPSPLAPPTDADGFAPTPTGSSGRLALVNDHPAMSNPAVIDAVHALTTFYVGHGFEISDDLDAEATVRAALDRLRMGENEATREALQQALREHDLAGVVYVRRGLGEGAPHERLEVALIEAEPAPANE